MRLLISSLPNDMPLAVKKIIIDYYKNFAQALLCPVDDLLLSTASYIVHPNITPQRFNFVSIWQLINAGKFNPFLQQHEVINNVQRDRFTRHLARYIDQYGPQLYLKIKHIPLSELKKYKRYYRTLFLHSLAGLTTNHNNPYAQRFLMGIKKAKSKQESAIDLNKLFEPSLGLEFNFANAEDKKHDDKVRWGYIGGALIVGVSLSLPSFLKKSPVSIAYGCTYGLSNYLLIKFSMRYHLRNEKMLQHQRRDENKWFEIFRSTTGLLAIGKFISEMMQFQNQFRDAGAGDGSWPIAFFLANGRLPLCITVNDILSRVGGRYLQHRHQARQPNLTLRTLLFASVITTLMMIDFSTISGVPLWAQILNGISGSTIALLAGLNFSQDVLSGLNAVRNCGRVSIEIIDEKDTPQLSDIDQKAMVSPTNVVATQEQKPLDTKNKLMFVLHRLLIIATVVLYILTNDKQDRFSMFCDCITLLGLLALGMPNPRLQIAAGTSQNRYVYQGIATTSNPRRIVASSVAGLSAIKKSKQYTGDFKQSLLTATVQQHHYLTIIPLDDADAVGVNINVPNVTANGVSGWGLNRPDEKSDVDVKDNALFSAGTYNRLD